MTCIILGGLAVLLILLRISDNASSPTGVPSRNDPPWNRSK